MNTKIILGFSFVAVFAVAMIFGQGVDAKNGATHLDIKSASLEDNGDGTATAKLTTATAIHKHGQFGAFGYGWITGFTGATGELGQTGMVPENVLAMTSHICAADSLVQGNTKEAKKCPGGESIGVLEFLRDNVPGFGGLPTGDDLDQNNDGPKNHPHILDLIFAGADCAAEGALVEVDVGRTLATGNNISPDAYTLILKGNKAIISGIPLNGANLPSAVLGAYASFNIVPLDDGAGNITNLCLTDLTVTPAA